jgi:hypothetical protein
MKKSAYGQPILLSENRSKTINKIEIVDELSIQNLVFDFPECLPISDIDESFNPLIPVCMELRTPVGPLDILMVTPNGDLAIMETKLWRNPEARRKVIAQILDYANELSKWTYEDLQRELNRKLNRKGNTLFEVAKAYDEHSILSEADFVDTVTRNLARGKFLLLIIGDGIREGASGIADFLTSSAHLNFIFGMIELTIYDIEDGKKIVLPRTIVKTTEIQKINIELPSGLYISNSNQENDKPILIEGKVNNELEKRRQFFTNFWTEFVAELDLDDPGQALPKPTITQNLYIYPAKNKNAWISAYFSQSTKRVGVYFRCQNDQNGISLAESLLQYSAEIKKELNDEVIFTWDANPIDGFGVRLYLEDVYAENNRAKIKDFFAHWINQFVNVLRPRIKEIEENY